MKQVERVGSDKKWTKRQISFLICEYGRISTKDIAARLNRSVSGVKHKASKLKIKKGIRNAENVKEL